MKKMIICLFFTASLAFAGDVYVKTFETINHHRTENYVRFTVKVQIVNTGGTSGNWKTELRGLDKDGFPIVKQRVDIETFLPAFGEIKDADDMIFESAAEAGVVKWEVVTSPRGY